MLKRKSSQRRLGGASQSNCHNVYFADVSFFTRALTFKQVFNLASYSFCKVSCWCTAQQVPTFNDICHVNVEAVTSQRGCVVFVLGKNGIQRFMQSNATPKAVVRLANISNFNSFVYRVI